MTVDRAAGHLLDCLETRPDTAQPSQCRRRRRLVRTLAPDRTCLVVLTVSGRFDGPEAGLPAFSAFLSRRGPGGSFQVVMGERASPIAVIESLVLR